MNRWRERPPVVVFCNPDSANLNRLPKLRRGAYELAGEWNELFRVIEDLFGRTAGQ